MTKKKVRIGIDVGGTFTDAIILDNDNGQIIAKEKVPTTHYDKKGVAQGIIYLITKLMKENDIDPSDVVFIAHGTTQATNALLEGDVASVGIIGVGSNNIAKHETKVNNILLAPGKELKIDHEFIYEKDFSEDVVKNKIQSLKNKNIKVFVVSQAYGVDETSVEKYISNLCKEDGFYVTSGSEISQLYGLKNRTRTAVINGSLIPKMLETANLTQQVVKSVNIESELMIMRADGGVMSIDQVRKRPILTMLSGLAAGVAGALMYEKVTDGIFFEAGGTSTDISVIKDGQVMLKNAQVGKFKTYVNSLDVRTLGIAGGSMFQIQNGKVIDVGPRSAHLANMEYECFSTKEEIENCEIKLVSPLKNDPNNYVILQNLSSNKKYAFTLAGAVNFLGYIEKNDYAKSDENITKLAWTKLGEHFKKNPKEIANEVVNIAINKVWNIVEKMIKEYKIDPSFITFVGGGGSASIITIPLAKKYNFKYKIAKNAPYISTIGVAMAMIREEIEKSVINPTKQDIKKIRNEILEKILLSGAKEQTVEISIFVDNQKNIIRACATGASDFKSKEENSCELTIKEKQKIVCSAFSSKMQNIISSVTCGNFEIVTLICYHKILGGVLNRKEIKSSIINSSGVIVLRKPKSYIKIGLKKDLNLILNKLVEKHSRYSDAGQSIPQIFVISKTRIYNYSGLSDLEQIKSLINMDLKYVENDFEVGVFVTPR